MKLSKCKFRLAAVKFLGHRVTADGIKVNPEMISTIQYWPLPQCVTQMRSFLGLASYYRHFIENFGKIAAPLTKMLENNRPLVWDDDAKNAFSELRTRLANALILTYKDFSVPFLLDFDSLDKGIGAVLSQIGKDQLEHPIAYFSSTLGKYK